MHWITIEYDFVFQIDEDCVIVGPVGENDPVEELWKHCEPVQQDDGFGTQVVCLKVKGQIHLIRFCQTGELKKSLDVQNKKVFVYLSLILQKF